MILRITTGNENQSPPREGCRGGLSQPAGPPRRLRLLLLSRRRAVRNWEGEPPGEPSPQQVLAP